MSDLRWALPAIVLICIWQNLGYTVILFLSGMINVPRDLYEAAAIDGANGIARIWYVTIPMLSGTTFFIVITSIINSFKVFGLINLMTHGGPELQLPCLYTIFTAQHSSSESWNLHPLRELSFWRLFSSSPGSSSVSRKGMRHKEAR